jgi:ubiquinone biosynthesis protein UbiJ
MASPAADADDRPASPLRAVAADAVAQGHRAAVAALAAALGHLLRQQDWARAKLRMHAGATVRLGVVASGLPAGLPPPEIRLRIEPDGLIAPADGADAARATLLLEPSAAMLADFARQGVAGLSRHLRIDGDVMLAAALGELARDLRWEAEEDLSRVLGDVAAHRLAGWLKAGLARARGLATSGLEHPTASMASWSPAVGREALRALGREIADLDDRLRRLEQRAERLETPARPA